MKTIWRKNFSIPRVDLNICSESAIGFHSLQGKTLGQNIINESIWVFENMDNIGTYFPKEQLRRIIKKTLWLIIFKPQKINRIHKKTVELNKKYFKFAEQIRQLSLKKVSNKELLLWHKKLYRWQYLSHGYSLPTTWFVDSDGEDLTRYIISFIKARMMRSSLNLDASSVFSLVTTPAEPSLSQVEELESLKIVDQISKNKKNKNRLVKQPNYDLITWYEQCPTQLKKAIKKHYYKWCWFPYTYLGPAYTLDYYLEVWQGLVKSNIDPTAEIKIIKAANRKKQLAKVDVINKLKFSISEKKIIKIATDIIWLKGYRKDCYYHGFFVLDLLLAEIGRRVGLTLLQVKYLLPQELSGLFHDGVNLAVLANERMKFSVLHHKNSVVKLISGKKAKHFLSKQIFEKQVIQKKKELNGTCACPGIITGSVCVVNIPSDIAKMKAGNIMVAHTTYPALVPAMKLASGIITEDGGITCHAAIVARELQVPCVVGTKIATQILKDGDKVAVDATKGIIRKI